MTYPNFKNKHKEETLIEPQVYLKDKKNIGKLPKKCIITYQKEAFEYIRKKCKNQSKQLVLRNSYDFDGFYTKDFIVIKIRGVGSPQAVLSFEYIIPYKIKEFINIGISGGLDKPGFFVCSKAIRDEGTSQHYISHSKYSYPDKELTERLEKSFKKLSIEYKKGANWTIDAPFRETKAEARHYKKEKVLTVEMEASALFAVAKFRKVKIAAAFFTSDILGEDWTDFTQSNPGFVNNGLYRLCDVAIDCFRK